MTPRVKLLLVTASLFFSITTLGEARETTTTPVTWTAIASKLAGIPTPVSCGPVKRTRGALGITYTVRKAGRVRSARIVLDTSVCASLRVAPKFSPWLPPESRFPDMASFVAVQTLAHEAMHARGIRNENRAECEGFLHMREVALALGFSKSHAKTLVYMEQLDPALNCDALRDPYDP